MPVPQRYYYFDFIRAALMLLGIPYHAALIYLPEVDWNVISPDKNLALKPVAGIIHSFRMQAFFLMSGFFAAMLLSRREPWAWLRSRYVRVGVPFATAVLLLIPMQIALIRFFDEKAAGQPWILQYRLFHFWFLPALLVLCSLLALSWGSVVSRGFRSALGRLAHPAAPWIVMLALIFWAALMSGIESSPVFDLPLAKALKLLSDPLTYLPYFAIGVVCNVDEDVFDRLIRIDSCYVIVGLSAAIIFGFFWYDRDYFSRSVSFISGPIAALFLSVSFFAICRKYLDFRNRFSSTIADASFTIYLLHQPVVMLLGFLLLTVRAPTLLEYVAICTVTFVSCLAAHLLVRRSVWLEFFLNGVVPKAGLFAEPWRDRLIGGHRVSRAAAEQGGEARTATDGNANAAAAGGGAGPSAAPLRAGHWRRRPPRGRRLPVTVPRARQD